MALSGIGAPGGGVHAAEAAQGQDAAGNRLAAVFEQRTVVVSGVAGNFDQASVRVAGGGGGGRGGGLLPPPQPPPPPPQWLP
jgi:hypothetical protein